MRNYAGWERATAFGASYLFLYLHFIYRWQYIKTQDLKVQLDCIAVQIIRYMHAN